MTVGNQLCAVMVTYRPGADTLANLAVLVRECGLVIVVDNASSVDVQEALAAVPGVELKRQATNIGLAAALNLGLQRAVELGFEWALTFDQDSRPEPGFANALWNARMARSEVGIVAPRIHEEDGVTECNYQWLRPHMRWPVFFEMVRCPEGGILEVTIAITSGSMVNLKVWKNMGEFDAGLFIDYVDIDFCLRLVRAGKSVAVVGDKAAVLHHRLGARKKRVLLGRDFRPMHHAPFRHYYMARNRVHTWRRHALAVPHWALFDFCFAVYNYARVLAFEDQRWAKVKAIVRGTWHGLLGRAGSMPP